METNAQISRKGQTSQLAMHATAVDHLLFNGRSAAGQMHGAGNCRILWWSLGLSTCGFTNFRMVSALFWVHSCRSSSTRALMGLQKESRSLMISFAQLQDGAL
eukprot:1287702-Amphidinium_carterae.1